MGDVTGISWCDHTHNVWIGCAKISAGCRLCYAERDAARWKQTGLWGLDAERRRTQTAHQLTTWDRRYWVACRSCGWRGEMVLFPECPKCGKPELRPARQRVFVNSMSDIFEDRADVAPWRNEFWMLTQVCSNLDFLILTKRPATIGRMVPRAWHETGWPANVWLGVSVEDQIRADERIPQLLAHPARVHWISAEPLLAPIDLERWLRPRYMAPQLDWIVAGGESGFSCRPMSLEWARSLRSQCQRAGVPFYMKQLGGAFGRREELEALPQDLRVREWPADVQRDQARVEAFD